MFLGELDSRRLSKVHRTCDLLALTSETDAFPLVLQEVMVSALPTVVCDYGRLGVYGMDGNQVLLIEPAASAVRDAMLLLTRNPHRRAAAGRHWSDFVCHELDRKEYIQRLRPLHEEALDEWDAKATSSFAVVARIGGSRRDGR